MVFNAVAMSNLHVLVFFVVITHPQHMVHMMNSTAKNICRLCRNRGVEDVRWQAFVRTSESQIPAFGHMCVFFGRLHV